MQNKATVIKQGLKKRAAFSYQQPTTHTLTNLNKKIKTDSFLVTQSQPISQSSTQLEPKQEIIIDDTASTHLLEGDMIAIFAKSHLQRVRLCTNTKNQGFI